LKLDHINIAAPMKLLETVRDFYCEILGFDEGYRPGFSKRGFWLYADDKPLIHLIESDVHQAHEQPGHLDHIAFRSAGLDQLKRRLEANRIEYRTMYNSELNMSQVFFKDPAGTGLEFNFPGES